MKRLRHLSVKLASTPGDTSRFVARSGVLVELTDDQGHQGIGEASPLPLYSPDNLADCVTALEQYEADQFWDHNPGEQLDWWLKRATATIADHLPAAHNAVQTALIDLMAKRKGIPVWKLLNNRHAPVAHSLSLNALLDAPHPDELVARARYAAANGFKTLKIKLGPADRFASDLEALRRIRAELGSAIALRLDVNCAWSAQVAPRLLERLAPINPELVEEPVEGGIARHLDLFRSCPVPLALDESLQNSQALENCAPHLKSCRVVAVVLKPMALGGIARCLALAQHAKELDLEVVITHLFDGPVALASAASLALTVGSAGKAHGLTVHPGLALDPSRYVLGIDGPCLAATDQAGLPLAFSRMGNA